MLNEGQIDMINNLLEPLKILFSANGVGLPIKYLNSGSSTFVQAVSALVSVPTQEMIELYKNLIEIEKQQPDVAKPSETWISHVHVLKLLKMRTHDNVAEKFVKNSKK
jgi:hypothetical protein